MPLISVDRLKPGLQIGKPLYDDQQRLLVADGYTLDSVVIRKLRERGYTYVFVKDGITDYAKPVDVIRDSTRRSVSRNIHSSFKEVVHHRILRSVPPADLRARLQTDKALKRLLNVSSIRKQAGELLEDLLDNHVRMYTALPFRTKDARSLEHAIDTALLSMLVGQELGFDWRDLGALASSALMHDIGKEILGAKNLENTVSKSERFNLYRQHSMFSTMILKSSDPASFKEQLTIEAHHEQINGNGYPNRLRALDLPLERRRLKGENQIYRLSQVLAVANRYDNLVSGAATGQSMTPEHALVQVIREAGTAWNSHIVRALSGIVSILPVGVRVRIAKTQIMETSGHFGVVVEANEITPLAPMVVVTHNPQRQRVEPFKVDFSMDERSRLEIIL